jgi:chromosome segregation ATPase
MTSYKNRTEERLQREMQLRIKTEDKAKEKMKELEIIEQQAKEKIREMKEAILEHTKNIQKTEAKMIAFSHESAKIRADKEGRYWGLVQKLHKEKDNNNRLEKRLRSKKQQMDELKSKNEKEIMALEEQLKLKLMDRTQVIMPNWNC